MYSKTFQSLRTFINSSKNKVGDEWASQPGRPIKRLRVFAFDQSVRAAAYRIGRKGNSLDSLASLDFTPRVPIRYFRRIKGCCLMK